MLFSNNQVDFSIFAFAQKRRKKLGKLPKKPTDSGKLRLENPLPKRGIISLDMKE
jgi:hypothetical protein